MGKVNFIYCIEKLYEAIALTEIKYVNQLLKILILRVNDKIAHNM